MPKKPLTKYPKKPASSSSGKRPGYPPKPRDGKRRDGPPKPGGKQPPMPRRRGR